MAIRVLGTGSYLPPKVVTNADIAAAPAAVQDKTELDALVAYLQSLGRVRPRS